MLAETSTIPHSLIERTRSWNSIQKQFYANLLQDRALLYRIFSIFRATLGLSAAEKRALRELALNDDILHYLSVSSEAMPCAMESFAIQYIKDHPDPKKDPKKRKKAILETHLLDKAFINDLKQLFAITLFMDVNDDNSQLDDGIITNIFQYSLKNLAAIAPQLVAMTKTQMLSELPSYLIKYICFYLTGNLEWQQRKQLQQLWLQRYEKTRLSLWAYRHDPHALTGFCMAFDQFINSKKPSVFRPFIDMLEDGTQAIRSIPEPKLSLLERPFIPLCLLLPVLLAISVYAYQKKCNPVAAVTMLLAVTDVILLAAQLFKTRANGLNESLLTHFRYFDLSTAVIPATTAPGKVIRPVTAKTIEPSSSDIQILVIDTPDYTTHFEQIPQGFRRKITAKKLKEQQTTHVSGTELPQTAPTSSLPFSITQNGQTYHSSNEVVSANTLFATDQADIYFAFTNDCYEAMTEPVRNKMCVVGQRWKPITYGQGIKYVGERIELHPAGDLGNHRCYGTKSIHEIEGRRIQVIVFDAYGLHDRNGRARTALLRPSPTTTTASAAAAAAPSAAL